jgi:hypothetical protein
MIFIVAVGAVWTSVMSVGGAAAMAPIAAWLWLTVLVITRRAATREHLRAGRGTRRFPLAR